MCHPLTSYRRRVKTDNLVGSYAGAPFFASMSTLRLVSSRSFDEVIQLTLAAL